MKKKSAKSPLRKMPHRLEDNPTLEKSFSDSGKSGFGKSDIFDHSYGDAYKSSTQASGTSKGTKRLRRTR